MTIRTITPPKPFLTPFDIAGSAVEQIDGYTGWLGRCLAPQLLE